MTTIILCYVAAIVIGVLGVYLYKRFLKFNIKLLSFSIGTFMFLFLILAYVLVYMICFNNIEYYNTLTYKIIVMIVAVLFLEAIRFSVFGFIFCRKDREESGVSFFSGLGFGAVLFSVMYMAAMILIIVYRAVFSGYVGIDDAALAIDFADNSKLSIFMPAILNVFGVVIALIFMGIQIFSVLSMYKLKVKYSVSTLRTLLIYFMIYLANLIFIMPIILYPFLKMNPYILGVTLLVCLAISFLSNLMIPKLETKRKGYTRQFD